MAIVILVTVVILVGVVLIWRSATAEEQNTGKSRSLLGLWGLVGGLAAAVGVAMIGQATFGWVSDFDPSGWLRIVISWLFPAGVITSVILGALSLKQNSARRFGMIGLIFAVLSIAAFVAILVSVDY